MQLFLLYIRDETDILFYEVDENAKLLQRQRYFNFAELPRVSSRDQLVVLVPGKSLFLTEIKLPKASRAELLKALPYALEDQLAENVEKLYFALGTKNEADKWAVAAMKREKFEFYLTHCLEQGLSVDGMMPDFLALPFVAGQWTVYIDKNQALVRTDFQHGFVADIANLALLLKLKLDQTIENLPRQIVVYNGNRDFPKDGLASVAEKIKVNQLSSSSEPWDWKELIEGLPFNLLQGKYRPKKRVSSRLDRYWRYAYFSAAVWLVILFGTKIGGLIYFHVRDSHLNKQLATLITAIFPGQTQVEDPRAKTRELVSQLLRASRGDLFIHLLAEVGPILIDDSRMNLLSISYQNKKMDIKLQADNVNQIAALTQKLNQKSDLTVDQNQVNIVDKKATVEITIGEK